MSRSEKFWKGIRTAAKITSGIIVGGVVASMFAFVPALSVGATIALSNVATLATFAGIGGIALTGATAAVAGIVNGIRYLTSKNYRAQVKQRRLERKQNRKNRRNKNKDKDKTKTKSRFNIFKWLWNKISRKRKSNDNKTDDEEVETEEKSDDKTDDKKDDRSVGKKTGTTKAAGYYNNMSDDNKALYDSIMKKSSDSIFKDKDIGEVQKLKTVFGETVKSMKEKIAAGEKLTPEEEKELAQCSALYTKANNRLKKMLEVQAENVILSEEQVEQVTARATTSKISRK